MNSMVCVIGRQLWLFAAFALVSGTVPPWKLAQGNAHEDAFTGCIVSFVDGCVNPGREELNVRSLASLQLVGEENEYESLCLARAQETYQACGNEEHQQVISTFTPTGATTAFPSDDVVAQARLHATQKIENESERERERGAETRPSKVPEDAGLADIKDKGLADSKDAEHQGLHMNMNEGLAGMKCRPWQGCSSVSNIAMTLGQDVEGANLDIFAEITRQELAAGAISKGMPVQRLTASDTCVSKGWVPRTRLRRVWDAFTFFNEFQVLRLRLHTLAPVVHRFVLAEATRTHSNEPKELYFQSALESDTELQAFLPQMKHLVIDDLPDGGSTWEREIFQRNALVRGLADMEPDDLIIVGDCDEIPDPHAIHLLRSCDGWDDTGPVNFYTRFFNFRFSYQFHSRWSHPQVSTLKWLTGPRGQGKPENLRFARSRPSNLRLADAGWHLSFFMDAQGVMTKLKAYAHHEQLATSVWLNESAIQDAILSGKDNFYSDGHWNVGKLFDISEYENFCSSLPPRVRLLPSLYKDWLPPSGTGEVCTQQWRSHDLHQALNVTHLSTTNTKVPAKKIAQQQEKMGDGRPDSGSQKTEHGVRCSASQIADIAGGQPHLVSNCPRHDAWLDVLWRESWPRVSATLVSIGCNKGHEFVSHMHLWSRNNSFSASVYKAFAKHSFPDVARPSCTHIDGEEEDAQREHKREEAVTAAHQSGFTQRPTRGYCIEPMPQNTHYLQTCMRELGFLGQIHVIGAAVSSVPGTAAFPDGPAGAENLGLDVADPRKMNTGAPSVQVQVLTLDGLVQSENIETIDFLSIDTEGNDMRVILGAIRTLAAATIRYLEFAYHNIGRWAKSDLEDLIELLDHLNFDCYWAMNSGMLARLTGCWHESYSTQHKLSKIACVSRQEHATHAKMQRLAGFLAEEVTNPNETQSQDSALEGLDCAHSKCLPEVVDVQIATPLHMHSTSMHGENHPLQTIQIGHTPLVSHDCKQLVGGGAGKMELTFYLSGGVVAGFTYQITVEETRSRQQKSISVLIGENNADWDGEKHTVAFSILDVTQDKYNFDIVVFDIHEGLPLVEALVARKRVSTFLSYDYAYMQGKIAEVRQYRSITALFGPVDEVPLNFVTLVTQCSMDRLPRLKEQAVAFGNAPLSVAIYVPFFAITSRDQTNDDAGAEQMSQNREEEGALNEEEGALNEIRTLHQELSANGARRVTISLVFGNAPQSPSEYDDMYPVNTLRNVALLAATTEMVLLVDVDFVPSTSLVLLCTASESSAYELYRQMCQRGDFLMVVAFELPSDVNALPKNPAELQRLWQQQGGWQSRKHLHVHHFSNVLNRHLPSNFDPWWFSAKSPYAPQYHGTIIDNYSMFAKYTRMFEPYMIANREAVPLYDERFRGYGFDKISHAHRVAAAGAKFRILPHVFLTSRSHEPSHSFKRTFGNGRDSEHSTRVLKLWNAFKRELDHNYTGTDTASDDSSCSDDPDFDIGNGGCSSYVPGATNDVGCFQDNACVPCCASCAHATDCEIIMSLHWSKTQGKTSSSLFQLVANEPDPSTKGILPTIYNIHRDNEPYIPAKSPKSQPNKPDILAKEPFTSVKELLMKMRKERKQARQGW